MSTRRIWKIVHIALGTFVEYVCSDACACGAGRLVPVISRGALLRATAVVPGHIPQTCYQKHVLMHNISVSWGGELCSILENCIAGDLVILSQAIYAGNAVPVCCRLGSTGNRSTHIHRHDRSRSVQRYGLLADRPSSNPALRFGQFQQQRTARNDSWGDDLRQEQMTMQGTIGKTAILLLIVMCGAGYVWQQTALQLAAATSTAAIVSLKGSLSQIAMVCSNMTALL